MILCGTEWAELFEWGFRFNSSSTSCRSSSSLVYSLFLICKISMLVASSTIQHSIWKPLLRTLPFVLHAPCYQIYTARFDFDSVRHDMMMHCHDLAKAHIMVCHLLCCKSLEPANCALCFHFFLPIRLYQAVIGHSPSFRSTVSNRRWSFPLFRFMSSHGWSLSFWRTCNFTNSPLQLCVFTSVPMPRLRPELCRIATFGTSSVHDGLIVSPTPCLLKSLLSYLFTIVILHNK